MFILDSFNVLNSIAKKSIFNLKRFYLLKNSLPDLTNYKIATPILHFNTPKLLESNINSVYNYLNWIECSALDDLRRQQLNKIIGKIGIKKKDAGMYWKQYKTKRIKIRKRKRVI